MAMSARRGQTRTSSSHHTRLTTRLHRVWYRSFLIAGQTSLVPGIADAVVRVSLVACPPQVGLIDLFIREYHPAFPVLLPALPVHLLLPPLLPPYPSPPRLAVPSCHLRSGALYAPLRADDSRRTGTRHKYRENRERTGSMPAYLFALNQVNTQNVGCGVIPQSSLIVLPAPRDGPP